MRTIFIIAAAAAVSGCMQDYYLPDRSTLTEKDYGPPIAQEKAEAVAKEFILRHLKDPDSAKFQCSPVHQGAERDAMIYGGNVWAGYVLRCDVNAKNSFGGYTGFEPFVFVFNNGQLLRVYHGQGSPMAID